MINHDHVDATLLDWHDVKKGGGDVSIVKSSGLILSSSVDTGVSVS